MNDIQAAKELTAAAKELTAAPRPWDRRTLKILEDKIRDSAGEAKEAIGSITRPLGLALSLTTRGRKQRALSSILAVKSAALHLQTTANDLVRAAEGLQSYVDASMPMEASVTAAAVRLKDGMGRRVAPSTAGVRKALRGPTSMVETHDGRAVMLYDESNEEWDLNIDDGQDMDKFHDEASAIRGFFRAIEDLPE